MRIVFGILTIFLSSCHYQVTERTFAGAFVNSVAGFQNGMLEAYQADRAVFEKSFDADKYGPFGSESWRGKYKGNNPDNGYKHWWSEYYQLDFDHTAATSSRLGLLTGSFLIVSEPKNYHTVDVFTGIGIKTKPKKKFGHYVVDFFISSASFGIGSYCGYEFMRN